MQIELLSTLLPPWVGHTVMPPLSPLHTISISTQVLQRLGHQLYFGGSSFNITVCVFKAHSSIQKNYSISEEWMIIIQRHSVTRKKYISYIHRWFIINFLEWWVWGQISCPHYVSKWYAIVKGYWYHFCSHWMYWKLFRDALQPLSELVSRVWGS